MKNKIYSLLLLFSTLITYNSCSYFDSKDDWIVDMEVEGTVNGIDTLIKNLKELNLPLLEIKQLNDTIFNLTFMLNFDTVVLSKLFKNISVEFQETYDFVRFDDEVDSFYIELANFGCENMKKFIDYKAKTSDNNELNIERIFWGGSKIGEFSFRDTSKINKSLSSSKILKRLPSDLVFSWGKLLKSDSLSLYMIKKNSIKKGLSEVNITNISLTCEEKNYSSEYDENDHSTDLDSKLYYEILFTFDSIGAVKIYEMTRRNIGFNIATKLNGTIFCAAQVNGAIEEGQMTLSLPSKQDIIRFYKSILFDDIDGSTKVNKFEIR